MVVIQNEAVRSEGSILLGDQLLSLGLQYLAIVQMDSSPDLVGLRMTDETCINEEKTEKAVSEASLSQPFLFYIRRMSIPRKV